MKLLKIKWENIMTIFYLSFFIVCIINHINRNGFNANMIMYEIIIYSLVLGISYISIYSVRQNLKERK